MNLAEYGPILLGLVSHLLVVGKGGNLQLMLGGQNRRKAAKNFFGPPQKKN